MSEDGRATLHATAVAVGGRAALILGPSGAGKSTLALQAIMQPFSDGGQPVSAQLVADDRVVVERSGTRLIASPPPSLAGKIEVRGVGILEMPHLEKVEVGLAIMLKSWRDIDRLPDPHERHTILGLELPIVSIDPAQPGAVARLVLAALRIGRQ